MRQVVLSVDKWLTEKVLLLACLMMGVVCCLGLWQVLARFVFEQPSDWTEEVMRRLLIWCVMFGIVAAFRRGALVSVDLMLRTAKGSFKTILSLFITTVTLFYLMVLAWYGTHLVMRVRMQTFSSIDLSIGWAYAAIPVGAILCMVGLLAHHLDPVHAELETAL